MRVYFSAQLVMLSLAITACSISKSDPNTEQVLTNLTIVSPHLYAPIENAWIVVRDDRIAEIGTGTPPAGGVRHDFDGAYAIPGLIDSHVHLYHATGLKPQLTDEYDELYDDYMAQMPKSYLYFGFTSVIELNTDRETNSRILAAPLHPRLFHCGQGVIMPDGFMALETPKEQFTKIHPGFLYDHYRSRSLPENVNASDHTPEAAVNYVKQSGGQCLKLYFEEALWWPGPRKPTFHLPSSKIIQDVTKVANAGGLPVLLHATTPNGMKAAITSDVNILAHGMWEWPRQPFDAATPLPEYQAIMDELALSGVKLQPTFTTIANTKSMYDPTVLEDPRWLDVIPKPYLEYLKTDAQSQRLSFERMFAGRIMQSASSDTLAEAQIAFNERYKRLIARFSDQGGSLLFGTDTAVGGFGWGAPPGLAGYWEIQTWADIGVPLPELLAALTLRNAEAFNLDRDLGSIEVGKKADIAVLKENPLISAAAYDTITHVILDGQILERASLSAKSGNLTDYDPNLTRPLQ